MVSFEKIQAARDEGWSDEDIVSHLANKEPKILDAKKEGWSDSDILEHYKNKKPPESPVKRSRLVAQPEQQIAENEIQTQINEPKKEGFSFQKQLEHQNRMEELRGKAGATTIKEVLSGATLGGTEHIPGLKLEEGEGTGAGKLLGEAIPLALGGGALGYIGKFIPAAYRTARTIYGFGAAAALGGGFEASKEAIEGEELNPYNIGLQALTFAGLHGAFVGGKKVYDWFTTPKGIKSAGDLVKGVLPTDVSPSDYKWLANEVAPAMVAIGEEEYASALAKSQRSLDENFAKKMANVRAKHEADLYKLANEKQLGQAEAQAAEAAYEQELRAAEEAYALEKQAVEEANQQVMAEFEQAQSNFEMQQRTQNVVQDAIQSANRGGKGALIGDAAELPGLNLGLELPLARTQETLPQKVGQIFSKTPIQNTRQAGLNNIAGVKATATADYEIPKALYKVSDELNAGLSGTHEDLANELRLMIHELELIENRTPMQQKKLTAAKKVQNKVLLLDEEGVASGLAEVSNQELLEEAKGLRYYVDQDFTHGNESKTLSPLIEMLQDAAQQTAISLGDEAATQANTAARTAYRKWSELYNNKYIRTYRNKSNFGASGTFKRSLTVDNFLKLDDVLSQTNAGQQLADQTRRALVEKQLEPFFDNPRTMNRRKFDEALKELAPVLKEGQEKAIRQEFNQARRTEGIKARQLSKSQAAKESKLQKVPEFKPPKKPEPKLKGGKEITEVSVPLKGQVEVTPEMKTAAKKMNITPGEIQNMMKTPDGLRELRSNLKNRPHGERIFEEIKHRKIREIFNKGQINRNYTGKELAETINNGKNFDVLAELLGEEEATLLLEQAQGLKDSKFTRQEVKKWVKKAGSKYLTIKTLGLLGLL